MKYKHRLAEKIAEKQAFEQEQQKLRKKYKIHEDGIIQIKKRRLLEIIFKVGADTIRTLATMILCTLAAVGLTALVYVGPRMELVLILQEVLTQLHRMLGV
ncbi:hypothetical protein LK537_27305 [Lachnoclostridium pacaense]|uniref:hypothetical protein n=1 Tax=Enterocloster hominis (ex Hitch et al. 2024) TaxID=1917870 RepID=UPI001D10738A|nr:hypothetical protein [Lachnoclostridium pacaense]MCC2821007.1 hypothetical protein [Lachnoclostridium pacaense]